ncbi:MAG: catalase family peroxidase, partial [Bryobacteraceae bacterium]
LIDTLEMLFGKHAGFRRVHAKGVLCEGMFNATAAAAALSRAAHFAGGIIPVTVRFSDFTGIPTIPDGDPNASPRGMAIRFHLPHNAATDIVAHSYDGFPVGTAEEFLEFLRALAPAASATAGQPSPLEAFLRGRPQALQFVQTPKPAPVSFATEAYYGVNAFRFTNAEGTMRHGRYRILPAAGQEHLGDEEAASRPPNFLFDELSGRFRGGPVRFSVAAQLAGPRDPVTNASLSWPEDREVFELGTLTLSGRMEDSDAKERSLIFDPTRLVDGIEDSGDPLIQARARIYSIAYERRNAPR